MSNQTRCKRCRKKQPLYPVVTMSHGGVKVCFNCKLFILQLQGFIERLEFLDRMEEVNANR